MLPIVAFLKVTLAAPSSTPRTWAPDALMLIPSNVELAAPMVMLRTTTPDAPVNVTALLPLTAWATCAPAPGLEGLQTVKDPTLAAQLLAIARADVLRLDRLITDVADASRIDAQLARARFEPVDLGAMIESMLSMYEGRGVERGVRVAFARPRVGVAVVMGEDFRLARVVQNLVDNAVSFSPEGGLVEISATRVGDEVIIYVEDEGPGVPPESREAVFRRFHSERPEGEEFGRHSGLGLAIAKTIVEGHGGRIEIEDRPDGRLGGRFAIRLPAAGVS